MRPCLSTALTMSMRASAATDTAVRASISMPVRSAVRTVAVTSTPSSATVRSTATPCTAIGCASGISSGVRLTAWMPAMRATASASPLGTSPSRSAATAAAESRTRPAALASRAVTALADTSTMWALPSARTCVRPPGAPDRPDASDVPDAWAPPSVRGASEALTSVLPVEHEHVHDLAGDELGDVLGDDEQGVGPGQVGDEVRALAGDRHCDEGALGRAGHDRATELAPPLERGDARDERGRTHPALLRRQA